MRYFGFVLIVIGCVILSSQITVANYVETDEDATYMGNYIDDVFQPPSQKRGCIRRGGNCDHRSNDCCFSSSCRCNLWGSNCRCQRMGLFQKWG